ncbi:MAG: hypothetical protein HYR97_07175 [Candidatus Melainabacteria bacterium]|nr:hypothetical protein [Candidatus Melainabacteria bacterium]
MSFSLSFNGANITSRVFPYVHSLKDVTPQDHGHRIDPHEIPTSMLKQRNVVAKGRQTDQFSRVRKSVFHENR